MTTRTPTLPRTLGLAVTAAGAALLMSASGCAKATFINPAVAPGESHEEWTDFFLGGLIGNEEFDVREFCPGEAAKVATGGNFLTGLVSVVTVFIYTPRKVYITCAAARPAPLPLAVPQSAPPAVPLAPVPTSGAPAAPLSSAPAAEAPAVPGGTP